MDVYDEVDRRENDAGERGHGEQPGVAAGCPPPVRCWRASRLGEEQAARGGRSGTAGPSFLIPPAGARGRFLHARGCCHATGRGGAGGGCWVCPPPPELWGWGTSPGLILWGAPGPQGRVPGGGPFSRERQGAMGMPKLLHPWLGGTRGCAPKGFGGPGCLEPPPPGRGGGWGRRFRQHSWAPLPAPARWPRARACVLPAPRPARGGDSTPGPPHPHSHPLGWGSEPPPLMPGPCPQCG